MGNILKNKTYLYLTEFFSGMSVMAVELAASRLMAPYFSSSQIVYTIIIGTVMIAMALGNVYGGRTADRVLFMMSAMMAEFYKMTMGDNYRFSRLLAIAGAWIAAIPLVGRYVLIGISGALVLSSVNSGFLIVAAFISCMVIFVYPLFLLGTVTPSLVRYIMENAEESGEIVGRLGAFNTVGSIMSMNRTVLIQGFLRIFFPMLCGEIVGMLVGMGVGLALGLEPFQIFFFIILPIMAGGVGEGAIPLSIGYATLLHMDQGVALGRVLPMVMLGGLTAIIISGCLNQLGKRYPHLTGEGQLMPNRANADTSSAQPAFSGKTDVTTIASGALLAVLLYMLGMLGHKLIGLPAPVGMLFMAVLVKLCNGASPRLLEGSQVVYKFFQTSVTYPILFAVGVAITPWQELVNAFTVSNLLVIVSTVSALVATGFFVGKKIGMHPIDVAIVSCCQSGQGGTGDVAILTAGNRMSLMPFAQIATRIGGAINVSISLLILGNFLV